MRKLDELFNDMNKDIETQNKLRDEMHRCKKELEETERKYFESRSRVCSPLHQIVSIVKTYNDSTKDLFDIGIFLATYDELKLHKLCDDVLRDDMDISEISKICDAIIVTILEIVPYTFMYVVDNSTVYDTKYAMINLNIRSTQDYEKVEKVCRMISKLELLQSYLSGLFVFKGGNTEYYDSLLPEY